MITQLQKYIFFISAILLFVFNAPKLLGTSALNLGLLIALKEIGLEDSFQANLLWGAGLRSISLESGKSIHNFTDFVTPWHLPESLGGCGSRNISKYLLRLSENYASNPFMALRVLGRISLCEGSNEEALSMLHQSVRLDEINEQNPLIWLEIGDLYDHMEEPSLTIEAYKRAGFLGRVEQAGVQYLKKALSLRKQGDSMAATDILDQGLTLLPAPISLLYSRYRIALSNGDDKDLIEKLETRLTYFELDSIAPRSDARLRHCDVETMARLVSEGMWNREKLNRIVSYRVWQYPSAETEQFISELLHFFPNDVDLLFYHGELYQRIQAWEKAREKYEQVIRLDASYTKAYLRLADVLQESCGDALAKCHLLDEIEENYERYISLVPDDLLGSEKIIEFFKNVKNPKSKLLEHEYRKRTDDRQIVAEQFGVSVDQVFFGPNMIDNGGFEEWLESRPKSWWQYTKAGGEGVNIGYLKAGSDFIDALDGKYYGRMVGLWVGNNNELTQPHVAFACNNDQLDMRCEFHLRSQGLYLFSFFYRTSENENIVAGPWFGLGNNPFVGTKSLPNTDGEWHKIVLIDNNQQNVTTNIRLFFRLLSKGEVWWDNVSLREIYIKNPHHLN